MSKALIILGDQLFPLTFYGDYKHLPVFMAEDLGLCTHFQYHKHKITFFLSAMRTYADELRQVGHNVFYHELSDSSFTERLKTFIKKNKIKKLIIGEIQDKFFEHELVNFFKKNELEFQIIETPMFLCSRSEFKKYLSTHKKPFMKTFYEAERRRLKVLIDSKGRPEGGKWSFDADNRKKAPKVLDNKEPDRKSVV